MPPRNWLFRINDILDAISAVRKYAKGDEGKWFPIVNGSDEDPIYQAVCH